MGAPLLSEHIFELPRRNFQKLAGIFSFAFFQDAQSLDSTDHWNNPIVSVIPVLYGPSSVLIIVARNHQCSLIFFLDHCRNLSQTLHH